MDLHEYTDHGHKCMILRIQAQTSSLYVHYLTYTSAGFCQDAYYSLCITDEFAIVTNTVECCAGVTILFPMSGTVWQNTAFNDQ